MDQLIKSYWLRGFIGIAAVALLAGCEHSPSSSTTAMRQGSAYQDACKSNPYLMKYNCSIKQVQQAAENGNPDAEYALGYMYYYGIGTTKDQQTAALWIERAAAAGQPLAKKAWSLINTGAMFTDLHQAASGQERESSQAASVIQQQEPRNVAEMNAAVHKEPITAYLPAYNAGRPENQPSKDIPQIMQQTPSQ